MADKQNSVHLKEFYRNVLAKSPLFYGHQFVVTFTGDLPDMIKSEAGDRSITYYVKSSSIPEIDIKENKVSFLSQQFVVPGGIMYGDSWDVELMLTNDIIHYSSMYEWQNWYADLNNDGGSADGHQKAIPNTVAHVKLLNSTYQKEIYEFNLVGVFPTKIPDLKMKYENAANPVSCPCTLCYQYMYRTDEGDPLQANS